MLIVGGALIAWYRHGRDPVYLDDPSIHIPAPPAGLTPAAGAVIRDGKSTRRALTTASLDLASRGLIEFDAEQAGLLGRTTELSIHTQEAATDDPVEMARLNRARARPLDDATSFLLQRLRSIGGGSGVIDAKELLTLGTDVGGFDKRLEEHVVGQGWFTETPAKATARWVRRGVLAIIVGGIGLFIGFNLPSDGLVVVGGALIGSGIVMLILASSMPSRTMPGAMIRAMLEAYRRTLEKTMAQARSMGEVVQTAAIPLIESPDDAVVWGVALGLQSEVERGPRADGRRRQVRGRAVRLLPGLVRQQLRWRLGRRAGRLGSGPDELVADPQLRRHDGGAGHHRELARVVGLGRRRGRVRWRRLGRRRRRSGRRLLIAAGTLAAMGATDTMEVFFERLNEGDVAAAVAMMDERTEMRIHVGDNARTLRGVEQVGGWFLRADKGIKMIPGDVRDLGNTYQADLVVLRPGAPSQHLDAQFRVEAGKITSINLTPFSR